MTTDADIRAVRRCLAAIKPGLDFDGVQDDTALLANRIITSLDVLDLILHLEHAAGRPIDRRQLVPGSFRDIGTIARVFIGGETP